MLSVESDLSTSALYMTNNLTLGPEWFMNYYWNLKKSLFCLISIIIRSQICKCHENCSVVTCTKLWHDLIIVFQWEKHGFLQNLDTHRPFLGPWCYMKEQTEWHQFNVNHVISDWYCTVLIKPTLLEMSFRIAMDSSSTCNFEIIFTI